MLNLIGTENLNKEILQFKTKWTKIFCLKQIEYQGILGEQDGEVAYLITQVKDLNSDQGIKLGIRESGVRENVLLRTVVFY